MTAVTNVATNKYGARVPECNIAGAAKQGTEIHELLQEVKEKGRLTTSAKGFLSHEGIARQRLAEIIHGCKIQPVAIETKIQYEQDGEIKYVGRIDMVAKTKGQYVIIDLKTQNNRPAYTTALQLSAYLHAWNQMHPDKQATQIMTIWLPRAKSAELIGHDIIPIETVLKTFEVGKS